MRTQWEAQGWVKAIAKGLDKLAEKTKVKKVRFDANRGSIFIFGEKEMLSAIEAETDMSGWVEIEITVDSGACDTVMPTKMCPHISILQTEISKQGMEYEVANGETILNLGARYCLLMTENATSMRKITFQIADIHKPLLSVSRISDLGYDCLLTDTGGELRDRVSGDTIPLHRRGNLYVMRAWVRQDESDFRRPQ